MARTIVDELLILVGIEPSEETEQAAEKVNAELTKIGAAAVAAAAAMTALAVSFAQTADRAAKTAASLGIATDEFVELETAMALGGGTSDQLRTALTALARNAEAASRGTGEAVEAFRQLGITQKQLAGLRPDELMALIAERTEEAGDAFNRTAQFQRIFGESGAVMVNVLGQGAAAFESAKAAGEDYGDVIAANAEASASFNDSVTRTRLRLDVIRGRIAAGLLPLLEKVSEAFGKAAEFVEEHFGEAIEALAGPLALFFGAGGLVVLAVPAINALSASFGILSAAMTPVILPALAIAAAVTAIYLAVDDLMAFMRGDDSLIGRFAETLGISEDLRTVLRNVGSIVKDVVVVAFDALKTAVMGVFDVIGQVVSKVAELFGMDGAGGFFSEGLQGIVSSAATRSTAAAAATGMASGRIGGDSSTTQTANNNITVNAAGLNADQVVAAVERRIAADNQIAFGLAAGAPA